MNKRITMMTLVLSGAIALSGAVGCKKSASQKIEDTTEDAAHEMEQGLERAGENIEDATE